MRRSSVSPITSSSISQHITLKSLSFKHNNCCDSSLDIMETKQKCKYSRSTPKGRAHECDLQLIQHNEIYQMLIVETVKQIYNILTAELCMKAGFRWLFPNCCYFYIFQNSQATHQCLCKILHWSVCIFAAVLL